MRHLLSYIIILMSLNAYSVDVLAHRGEKSQAPENSVEAVKLAWSNGAKFVEADFWETKEGAIICAHGKNDIKKLSGLNKEIPDITLEDLKTADLAANNQFKKMSPVRIPTMEDVMKAVSAGKVLYFEIKNYSPTFADKVEKCRVKCGLEKNQIVFISFSEKHLEDINKKLPGHDSLWIYMWNSKKNDKIISAKDAVATCKKIGAKGVSVGSEGGLKKFLTPEYVKAIKDSGLVFCAWTINDIKYAKVLIDMGVDIITTDNSAEFLQLTK